MRIMMVGDTVEELSGMWFYGGLERQVVGTARALAARGHDVQLLNLYWEGLSDLDALNGVDVVHIFNTGGPRGGIVTIAAIARAWGIPVVFSTVYWPSHKMVQAALQSGIGVQEKMMEKNRQTFAVMVGMADFLMPNAEAEAEVVFEDVARYGVPRKPYIVVPNAVDPEELFNPYEGVDGKSMQNMREWEQKFREKEGYILSVGRIEWRKNQLGLLRALRLLKEQYPDRDIRLLLIGAVAGDGDLLRMIEREAVGVNVAYIGALPPRVVALAMRFARVYCQPSYYETPGLANLEAAALGVPLVCGSFGSEPEYFGPYAFYCKPDDPESIAEAIDSAWDMRGSDRVRALQEAVLAKYNYARVAEIVEQGYRRLLEA